MSDHSKFSPSGADRWVTCTKSVEMEEGLPDSTSVYAEEGTDAHSLLEQSIMEMTRPSKLKPNHPAAKDVDVAYDYVAKKLTDPRYTVLSESKVYLTDDIYGTADITIIDTKACNIEIVDYKHGAGKMVEPDCRQLMIYGAAAVKDYTWMLEKPVKTVTTTIVQPRKPHDGGLVRSEEYTIEAIMDGVKPVIAAAKKIKNGETEFNPSESACQWCKAKANCPAFAKKALDSVGAYFTPVGCLEVPSKVDTVALTMEQKLAIHEASGLVKSLLSVVEDDIQSYLKVNGASFGKKLVAGSSNRVFDPKLTEDEIKDFLKNDLKMKVSEFTKQTLLGPAPIEKHIKSLQRGGKAKMELLQAKIVKPEGKPTIVPESDKRPALTGFFQDETANPLD